MAIETAKPLTPAEVVARKLVMLPDGVIEAFNDLIVQNFNGRSATFTMDRAANEVVLRLGISREEVFELRYLDVEPVYRQAGWKVVFDRPGYNETYKAFFTFTMEK